MPSSQFWLLWYTAGSFLRSSCRIRGMAGSLGFLGRPVSLIAVQGMNRRHLPREAVTYRRR